MRIRYLLLDAYGVGGTIRATFSMAGALARRGHDVEVASLRQPRPEPRLPLPPGVRLVSLTGTRPRRVRGLRPGATVRWATRAALRGTATRLADGADPRVGSLTLASDLWLRRYVRAQHDCVVVSTREALSVALARVRTEEHVAVAQEHNHIRRGAPSRADYVRWYPSLDALVTLTEGDAADYRALLGAGCRVETVPNAVPLGWVAGPARLEDPVVLAAGQLVHRKGFDLLIDAWGRVARDHPGWRLRIVGSGRERTDLDRRVGQAGLSGSVELVGFAPDVGAELLGCSVFALSSRSEGLPMVVLEAMATGVPVVAFDCPTGPRDLVVHGVTGLLVPPGDVAGLATAIGRLAADPGLRSAMGAAARDRAAAFDAEVVAARWERLFGELADDRGLSVGR
ncbi:hypothetical protein GCM10023168_36960 [Fodinibacter luteus]|uniref:D-inositol 3-phosphate glycosyltransferase n=1 Tax=Fodinibacter luteus TaxID=552064 RepID=A0ABP8KS09_9MICO